MLKSLHVQVSKPNAEHVALGVPNEDMKTWNKIETTNGPFYREGGLYTLQKDSTVKMGMVVEVYKSKFGVCFAVIENLSDVTAQHGNPFLLEARAKVWKRTETFYVTQFLQKLHAVPLLHACSAEPARSCNFETGMVVAVEERQTVQKRKTT